MSNLVEYISLPRVVERFEKITGSKKSAQMFMGNMLSIVNGNSMLKSCTPESIVGCAMMAASLGLSIDPSFGQAAILPYNGKAQFQMMVAGYKYLAKKSGLIRDMSAIPVYSDEVVSVDIRFNRIEIQHVPGGYRDQGNVDKISHYAAFIETVDGEVLSYRLTKKEVEAHAQKYSSAYQRGQGPWKTNFNAMACKTVLKMLIRQWGQVSPNLPDNVVRARSVDQAVILDSDEGEVIEYADNPLSKFE